MNSWRPIPKAEVLETETHWVFTIKNEYCMANTKTGKMETAYWTDEVGRLQKTYCPRELAEKIAKHLYREVM